MYLSIYLSSSTIDIKKIIALYPIIILLFTVGGCAWPGYRLLFAPARVPALYLSYMHVCMYAAGNDFYHSLLLVFQSWVEGVLHSTAAPLFSLRAVVIHAPYSTLILIPFLLVLSFFIWFFGFFPLLFLIPASVRRCPAYRPFYLLIYLFPCARTSGCVCMHVCSSWETCRWWRWPRGGYVEISTPPYTRIPLPPRRIVFSFISVRICVVLVGCPSDFFLCRNVFSDDLSTSQIFLLHSVATIRNSRTTNL